MVDIDEECALAAIRESKHFQDIEKTKKVKTVSIQTLSEDQGFIAVVYNVIVHFECDSTFSFIMKTPSLERILDAFALDKDKDDMKGIGIAHNRECEVYEYLAKCDVKAPKFYGAKLCLDITKEPGYILMESFVGRGTVLGLGTQVTAKQFINLAHQMGKLRAEVEKIGEKKTWDDPLRMENMVIDLHAKRNIPVLLEYDRNTFGTFVEKFKPFTNVAFFGYLQKRRAEELGVSSLTHSDLHSGNVMVKPQPDGSPSDEIATIFDWQLGFIGNALFDLARFSCITADADIRRGTEQMALDEYYNTYVKYSDAPNPKFTREVCQELYDLAVVMEALEFQYLFGQVCLNLKSVNALHLEAIKARFALRARLVMEDGLRAIDKYNLRKIVDNLL